MKDDQVSTGELHWNIYTDIRRILDVTRRKAFSAVNFAMVEAYWQTYRGGGATR